MSDIFLCFCHFPIGCPRSGVVFDCIDSSSFPSSLLSLNVGVNEKTVQHDVLMEWPNNIFKIIDFFFVFYTRNTYLLPPPPKKNKKKQTKKTYVLSL